MGVPEGGMFLWVSFKGCKDSMKLFEGAIKEGVAFVPGSVFFVDKRTSSFARLNYTNATPEEINLGVKRLYNAYSKIRD